MDAQLEEPLAGLFAVGIQSSAMVIGDNKPCAELRRLGMQFGGLALVCGASVLRFARGTPMNLLVVAAASWSCSVPLAKSTKLAPLCGRFGPVRVMIQNFVEWWTAGNRNSSFSKPSRQFERPNGTLNRWRRRTKTRAAPDVLHALAARLRLPRWSAHDMCLRQLTLVKRCPHQNPPAGQSSEAPRRVTARTARSWRGVTLASSGRIWRRGGRGRRCWPILTTPARTSSSSAFVRGACSTPRRRGTCQASGRSCTALSETSPVGSRVGPPAPRRCLRTLRRTKKASPAYLTAPGPGR